MNRAIEGRILESAPGEWATVEPEGFRLHVDLEEGDEPTLAESVARTLAARPRWLHFRWLYDEAGSHIYERITEQPEYYLTRTEDGILADNAGALRELAGDVTLVELGSGSSTKTRHVLEAWLARGPAHYVPIDISRSALEQACAELSGAYPDLAVEGMAARYARALPLIDSLSPLLLLFLGSSIGNFDDDELDRFLALVASSLEPDDMFLLGIDLVKDAATLEAAYNDAAGWTERFMLNLLARINRELGTAVPLDAVEYDCSYNPAKERVEMYLRFTADVELAAPELPRAISIAAGERVLVEISRKFHVDRMLDKLAGFGFRLQARFTDADRLFAVLLLRRGEDGA